MTAKKSPLGRDSMQFAEKMKKHHGEIERLVYAAEIECNSHSKNKYHCPLGKKCSFKNTRDHFFSCRIDSIRMILGDHVIQHDCEVQK
jgi:hypothetical protein